MRRLHNAAIFILIFIIYSNVLLYLNTIGALPLPPFVFHIASSAFLFLSSLVVIKPNLSLHPMVMIIMLVIGFGVGMFLLHIQTMDGAVSLATEFYLFVFLVSLYFIFSSSNKNALIAKYAILASCIISVAVNIYDFLHPFAMLPPDLALPGRASGFYVNPNGSGIALVLGLVLTIDVVPRKYREILALFFTIGIVLTFSRGAILCLFLVLLLMLYYKHFSLRKLSVFSLAFVLTLPFTASAMLNFALESEQFSITNIMQRLNWFSSFGQAADFSASERATVAIKSIDSMDANALFGIGISELSSWPVLPHNMYLLFGVQYGVLGWIIYPLFIFSCVAVGWQENKGIYVPFVAAMLFFGIISHNMMNTYFVLMAAALVAALGTHSKRDAEASRAANVSEAPASA